MAQKHNIDYTEKPMTRDGRIQGPSRRYRRLRHPSFKAAEWTAKNPLLQRGEIGFEIDTFKAKVGDGTTYWNLLPYFTSSGGGAAWGQISGDIDDQTDLQTEFATKQDVISDLSTIRSDASAGKSASDTIATYGDIVTYNASAFATAAQGAKADSAVQSVTEGTANGTISVDGSDVAVHGLGSAAYTSSSDYATAAQGAKADTAVQPADLPVNTITNLPLQTISASTSNIVLDGTTYTTYSVYQRARTENDEYPLLAKDSTSTASGTSVVSFDTQATVNHSTGTITAPNFNGLATKATADEDGNAIKTTYAKIGDTMPLDSMLVPDLDKRTPIASYEFDSSGATYKPLLRIPNNHSNPQDIPVLNAVFRITSTRTGVKTVCDCVLSSLRTTNGPLVLMRHHPGSTSSTTTGFDYVRTVYPKVLDNGYDWYFELRNPTNDSVHTKVDVYSSDTGITWIADGTISTFNSANQNQTAVALTTNNNLMWSITMPWTVSTANSAGYINSYLNKFVGGSLPVMGVSANGQSLVLLGTDKKFYPMSSTTVAIDPGFGAAVLGGAVASGTAVSWTNISSKRRTGTTEIPHNTLTTGESCYLRCTMDASGNIYSDNYVDTQMSAGYTWLYIGQAENATTIEVNTEGSCFYTLDANGKLTHINGKALFDSSALHAGDNVSDLSNDAGYITGISSGDVTTALGYTPADTDLSNLTATGKEVCANASMPSATYDDLTLGASGTQYAAPADGWFCISKKTNGTNQVVNLINSTGGGIRTAVCSPISNDDIYIYLPAKKGDVILCYYSAGGTTEFFRFIYANGSI